VQASDLLCHDEYAWPDLGVRADQKKAGCHVVIQKSSGPLPTSDRRTGAARHDSSCCPLDWLPIDSTCGGRGTCGSEGAGPPGCLEVSLPMEALRPGELEEGWRSLPGEVYADTIVRCGLLSGPEGPRWASPVGAARPNVRKVS